MFPLVAQGTRVVASTPMARQLITPAARTVTGVARDVTAKVSRTQLAKGVTIGSLATMGIDAVVDFFIDNSDEATANIKKTLVENGSELTEQQADALLDVVNSLNTAARKTPAEIAHDEALDHSEHQVYGIPNTMFELPTDSDMDRKRGEQLYHALRLALSFEQIEALMMLSVIANSPQRDSYLDHLEGQFRVSRTS